MDLRRCPCTSHVRQIRIESACKTIIEALCNLFDQVSVGNFSLSQCGKIVKKVLYIKIEVMDDHFALKSQNL